MTPKRMPAASQDSIPANVTYELLPFPKSFHSGLDLLQPDTHISITVSALPRFQGINGTISRAEEAIERGFIHVIPHIAARSIKGATHLDEILGRCQDAGIMELFVIGGDAELNEKLPYKDSLAVLGAVAARGSAVQKVGVAGYPSGHPNPLVNERLINDLQFKQELAEQFSGGMYIETQFDFSALAILEWIHNIRELGIHLPVQVGLMGAAKRETAMRAMSLAGAGNSWKFMRRIHLNPISFSLGRYTDKSAKIAEELADSNTEILGFTINTLGDVATTMVKCKPVHKASRRL